MNPESLDQVVGVHVGEPELMKLEPQFLPADNGVGRYLLKRLLELALKEDGLSEDGRCAARGAELNDCLLVAVTRDGLAAAETIQREL